MITVSSSFDARMSLNTRPELFAEVEFQQITVGAAALASFSATGQSANSQLSQLVSGVTQLPLYSRLEFGGWPLDASRVIMPDTLTDQVGAISSGSTDANLALNPLVITITLSQIISTVGLTLYFDTALGTYPPSFTVTSYNGATHIDTATGTACGSMCVFSHPVSNYNKLVITFNNWNAPGMKARMSQIIFGIIKIFSNKDLVEFSILKTIDQVNNNIQAGELRFAFDNRDGAYDFENPGGIYNYMTSKIKALPRVGFLNELVQLGVYYLSAWGSDQSSGKAAMQAFDTLALLDITFPGTTFSSKTLMYIAQAVLTQAGITNYSLHTNLNNITVTTFVNGMTCRQVLAHIATAACLTLYTDVNGNIMINALSTTASGYTLSYYNSQKPDSSMDEPLKNIIVKYGTTTDSFGNSIDLISSASYASAGREISIKDNPFIQTVAVANTVLTWLAAYYQRRKLYQNDWRQNPKLEPSDIIGIQTKYGTPNAQVLSQQLSFSAGGLSGQTKSRGM